MSHFDDLLRVQDHDTTIDRLRHQLASLPERAELAQIEDELAALERTRAEVAAQREAVAGRERTLEAEMAAVEAKIADVEGRLYSGAVTIPRELQAMQADVESLRRRRSTLEDGVLEAMTEREPLDIQVANMDGARAGRDRYGATLRAQIAEAEATIDAALAAETKAREEDARTLPADLSRLYEDLRRRLGGTGAARLVGARCGGCHLTLPATELDRIRREPPDALIRCDQCARILVR